MAAKFIGMGDGNLGGFITAALYRTLARVKAARLDGLDPALACYHWLPGSASFASLSHGGRCLADPLAQQLNQFRRHECELVGDLQADHAFSPQQSRERPFKLLAMPRLHHAD